MPVRRASRLLCLALALGACGVQGALTVRPVTLRGAGTRNGLLTVVAALELRSGHKLFGGLSGIELAPDGSRLWLISDRGHWIEARLERDARGVVRGLREARIGDLLDPQGAAVTGAAVDAEGLTRTPDGGLLVSFEHQHRIWRYEGTLAARPQPIAVPEALRRAPANGGLEAISALPDGRLVLLCEGFANPDGTLRGWIGRPGRYEELAYVPSEGFVPTDLRRLPDGDMVVLERRFKLLSGVSIRIRRFSGNALRAGARIEPHEIFRVRPPLEVDNFEGLAVERRGAATYLYIVSDDNFSALQRTLLYQLQL